MPSPTPTKTLWTEIAEIVGAAHAREAQPDDCIADAPVRMIAEPGNAEEIAAILSRCSKAGIAVIPRGGGTKSGWGNPARAANLILSTQRLKRLVEHAHSDLTATVEAGCTVANFQQALGAKGQRLALDPLWPERATIGGILATNDSGSLRVRFGALRDLIIGVTVVLPDGTIAKSGGKVVKNVAGYDLQKLMTGSFGTLGIITQATFRLYPLPNHVRSLTLTFADADSANQLALKLLDSQLTYTGIQLRAEDQRFQIDVRFEGSAEALDAQLRQFEALTKDSSLLGQSNDVWGAREALFDDRSAAVLKISVLPSQLAWNANLIRSTCAAQDIRWTYVAQAFGIGVLKLKAAQEEKLLPVIQSLRTAVESQRGSVVVLQIPSPLRSRVDVWGAVPDSIDLMRRVKQRFDPAGILNPGRFVGGI
ncbi:MAG TPA: FAD-binding oxidoreductase [Terriglobales bacterium]